MLKPARGSTIKQQRRADELDETSVTCSLNKHLIDLKSTPHPMMQLPKQRQHNADTNPYCYDDLYYPSQQVKVFTHTNFNKLQNFIKMAKSCLRYNNCNGRHNNGYNEPLINQSRYSLAIGILICIVGMLAIRDSRCLASPVDSPESTRKHSAPLKEYISDTTSGRSLTQTHIQSRSGPIDPVDYVDDGTELDALANQQQIPTAQLMSAAGHVVPENFFLPGGSIPANHFSPMQRINVPTYTQQHSSSVGMTPAQPEIIHSINARHVPGKYGPRQVSPQAQMDLLTSASSENETPLIDFNGYNLATQPDGREVGTPQVDLVEFLNERDNQGAKFHHQQQQQLQHASEQQVNDAYDRNQEQQQQQPAQLLHQNQHQQGNGNEHPMVGPGELVAMSSDQYGQSIGPDYQIIGQPRQQPDYIMSYNGNSEHQKNQPPMKPFGTPNKSSSREPSDMLKPLGNPKTVSSPLIDFAVNNLPKNTVTEKLAEKIPQTQTPTVFSFSSSKDPMEKGKAITQKKRNIMKQAEHMARMAVKAFNDKFGTNLGDATDIPFLLSTLGPLGFAQNLLFDPTLFITLLNSAEKAYMSDVLPAPAKTGVRVVLNAFRMPNKKRDKANLLNIISYLASGGQTPSNVPSKHRQGSGIEKKSRNKR